MCDKIYIFKDSDLKELKGVIQSESILLEDIREISQNYRHASRNCHYIDDVCKGKNVFALLANVDTNQIDERDESWICIQVGSGDDIAKEIISDFICMQPYEKDVRSCKTEFHKNTPDVDYSNSVRAQKYRVLPECYKKYKILVFDNSKFLNLFLCNADELPIDEMRYYVEVIFAYKTKAYYWNKSPRGCEARILEEIKHNKNLNKPIGNLVGIINKGKIRKIMIRKGGVLYDYVTGAGCSDDSGYVR